MYLVVGLGNPGSKYAGSRHNAGFDIVDLLADRLGAKPTKLKCKALLAETTLDGERIILAQPQTFMNLSGESVVELINWYKIPIEHLVVCYDDIDLALGALRVRAKGSAGTHNGMRSIIYLLGKDSFPRVRVGVGQPKPGWDLADHVLSGYQTSLERELAFGGYQDAADAVIELIRNGPEAANRLAGERTSLRYPKPEKSKKETLEKNKPNFSDIGRHIWEKIHAGRLNGASCCVTIDGKTAYQGIFGLADMEKETKIKKDSLFRLASMTKPVVAVAVMMMVERGKIALDAPISDILPEFSGQKLESGQPASRCITARDLLTHSSGLGHKNDLEPCLRMLFEPLLPDRMTLQNVVASYAKLPLDFEPGSKTGYSALAAFDVLARMVEIQANVPFCDFVKLALFEPLGMNDTTWHPTDRQWERVVTPYACETEALSPVDMGRRAFNELPVNYTSGGGGLLGTLPDYVRFAEMLLNEGEFNGIRILTSESVRQMRTPQLSPEKNEGIGATENWGLGMRVITSESGENQPLTKGSFGWSGAYGTHFWIDPERKLTAVFMRNIVDKGGFGSYTACEFERDVYAALN